MCSWSRPSAMGELGSWGRGLGVGLSWGSPGYLLFSRLSGKEEVLHQLQEENRRLSQEQERVSRADGGQNRQAGSGAGREPVGWVARAPGQAVSPALEYSQLAGRCNRWTRVDTHGIQGCWGPWGLTPPSLLAHSWCKSWSRNSRASSSWRASGGRRRATGRPRSPISSAGGYWLGAAGQLSGGREPSP